MDSPATFSTFIADITTALTSALGWVTTVISTLAGNYILYAVLLIGFAPVAIHWGKMLLNLSQN